jgi:hypothetical protein
MRQPFSLSHNIILTCVSLFYIISNEQKNISNIWK